MARQRTGGASLLYILAGDKKNITMYNYCFLLRGGNIL